MTDGPVDVRTVDAAAARLQDPRLQPLLDELARRLSASARPVRSIRLRDLPHPTREALADLLRADRLPDATTTVRIDRLAAGLHLTAAHIREVVATALGGLDDRAAERMRIAEARQAARDKLMAAAEGVSPSLVDWAAARAVARGGDLDAEVDAALTALEVLRRGRDAPGTPATVVAAAVCGDPHAIDEGRRVGDLLRSAARELHGGSWRTALRRGGLADDDVSSLVWVLPPGEPAVRVLTLAALRSAPLTLDGEDVLVVENPSVIQVARDRGHPLPLVCVSGQPSAAARLAVAQLVDRGARLLLHGDFDHGGLRIIELLLAVARRHGPGTAVPHRMGSADYLSAVDQSSVPLETTSWPSPSWSSELGQAMRHHGKAVFEEHVLDHLWN